MALVGFMGAGKSVVGRALAARLGLEHLDTDEILAARHGPVGEQLRRDGEAAFRAREAEVVAGLVARGPHVVSTGGGTVEAPGALDALLSTHLVLWLDAPLAVLAERVAGSDRPLWDGAVTERWARRLPLWARAHARIDAAPPAAEVVDAAARASAPCTFLHAGPSGPCPVSVVDGWAGLAALVDAVAPGRRILVTDASVDAAWGAEARAAFGLSDVVVLPAGEAHKTLSTWASAVDSLLERGATRDTTVLALGGGVVGDVAGFAAATALRGLPIVQLPTTLLAMVDAALGGKTAIDHPRGKNLIGAFHPPIALGAWPGFLRTLPARERRSAAAEVIKTAMVGDPGLLGLIGAASAETEVIARCLRVKSRVVERDPFDRAERLWLNAGHTVGHAIERAAGFGAWTHGEAVAVGLVAEARFAVRAGVCADPDLPGALASALAAAGLPTAVPELDRSALVAAAGLDKKGRSDTIRLPLPVRMGEMTVVELPRHELSALFAGSER